MKRGHSDTPTLVQETRRARQETAIQGELRTPVHCLLQRGSTALSFLSKHPSFQASLSGPLLLYNPPTCYLIALHWVYSLEHVAQRGGDSRSREPSLWKVVRRQWCLSGRASTTQDTAWGGGRESFSDQSGARREVLPLSSLRVQSQQGSTCPGASTINSEPKADSQHHLCDPVRPT